MNLSHIRREHVEFLGGECEWWLKQEAMWLDCGLLVNAAWCRAQARKASESAFTWAAADQMKEAA